MSSWPASKPRRVLAALERIGWRVKRQRGSHRLLTRPGWPDYEFPFHEVSSEKIDFPRAACLIFNVD